MTTVVSYISGHGFGHASRVTEVLNALRVERPDVAIAIRTPVERWFFEFNLRGQFTYTNRRLDVGTVQWDSLSVDPEASLRAYAEIAANKESLIAAEVAALSTIGPTLVFADIPALAFDVAAGLGVPGVAMTNFSWDWIYTDYVRDFPAYAPLVAELRASYGRAMLLLRLPLHGDLGAFPRIRDIPFVARKATVAPIDVRRRLGLPEDAPTVLLSFGGIGVTLHTRPSAPSGVRFIAYRPPSNRPLPPWCQEISSAAMESAGIRYEDLVSAADAVMTKPGYGIVAECIANGTPMIYTPRGRFSEYQCLVTGIEAHVPHAVISNQDLYAGRWLNALETVFAKERRQSNVDTDGARAATAVLLGLLDGQ